MADDRAAGSAGPSAEVLFVGVGPIPRLFPCSRLRELTHSPSALAAVLFAELQNGEGALPGPPVTRASTQVAPKAKLTRRSRAEFFLPVSVGRPAILSHRSLPVPAVAALVLSDAPQTLGIGSFGKVRLDLATARAAPSPAGVSACPHVRSGCRADDAVPPRR